MHTKKLAGAALALAFAQGAAAQQWEYLSYDHISGRSIPGSLSTYSSDGKQKARLMFPNADRCFRQELNAAVEKTDARTVVTLEPYIQGCPEVRFVIRNDGSGGHREIKGPSGWSVEKRERGLKPKAS